MGINRICIAICMLMFAILMKIRTWAKCERPGQRPSLWACLDWVWTMTADYVQIIKLNVNPKNTLKNLRQQNYELHDPSLNNYNLV